MTGKPQPAPFPAPPPIMPRRKPSAAAASPDGAPANAPSMLIPVPTAATPFPAPFPAAAPSVIPAARPAAPQAHPHSPAPASSPHIAPTAPRADQPAVLYNDAPRQWTAAEQLNKFLIWCHRNDINDVTLGTGKKIIGKRHGEYDKVTRAELTTTDMNVLFSVVKEGAALSLGKTYRGVYKFFVDREERERLRTRVTISHLTSSAPGLHITLRLIPNTPPTPDDIDMPENLRDALDFKYGLGLVCGKMESGKTWTLAAYISRWLSQKSFTRKIMHFGTPIEFLFDTLPGKDNIFQFEIPDAIESYPLGLKMAKSATPDVIVQEEVNDAETMSLIIDAAQSGIAVNGTLHISRVAEFPDALLTYCSDAEPPLDR